MPTFKLPLSGDVVQSVNPWFFSPIGAQFGIINVTVGQSSDPAVEAEVLSDVAGYGKQLGRIEDALVVLLNHFHPRKSLTKEEATAINDLNAILNSIADVKEKHKRRALRPNKTQSSASSETTEGTGEASLPLPSDQNAHPPKPRRRAR